MRSENISEVFFIASSLRSQQWQPPVACTVKKLNHVSTIQVFVKLSMQMGILADSDWRFTLVKPKHQFLPKLKVSQ